jgi:hypothetical protein
MKRVLKILLSSSRTGKKPGKKTPRSSRTAVAKTLRKKLEPSSKSVVFSPY